MMYVLHVFAGGRTETGVRLHGETLKSGCITTRLWTRFVHHARGFAWLIYDTTNCVCAPADFTTVLLCHVCSWTGSRWGPSRSTLAPAAHAKAAQLGQKLSMGLEAAYQVRTCTNARFTPY